jgi:hypothetical protein
MSPNPDAGGLIVRRRARILAAVAGVVVAAAAIAAASANANGSDYFTPGNLLVSRSVYGGTADTVQVGMALPPGCTTGCASAVADGTYPTVFNNDLVDSSFGVSSKIFLDELTPTGTPVSSLEVPNSTQNGVPPTKDQMVTSFSSKSELALNLSTDRQSVSFMGYLAPVNGIDVSNSNTPAVPDPTNPVLSSYYRVAAQVDGHGKFRFAKTNAYSGNNGRAAILNSEGNVLYLAGNAGNGGTPQPDGVITGAGAQILDPQVKALVAQQPGDPAPVGSFNITQLGQKPDKIGKDTNFRGLTIFDNVVYYTKGSGGNGVNTVYFIDTTGSACPNGVGLPAANAALPTSPIAYDPALLQTQGVTPTNMCILQGFPTAVKTKTSFPFGIWFASPTVLYVADEGNGDNTFSDGTFTGAAAQTTAGLQKWVLSNGQWHRAYTLKAGLDLGTPYIVPGYPTGNNGDGVTSGTGLPWSPATDGLRNITGRVNGDGTATIWAVTSTVSGNGDQGADPNKLVAVTDDLSATSLPGSETFAPVDAAGAGEVLRGVSFTPGTTG